MKSILNKATASALACLLCTSGVGAAELGAKSGPVRAKAVIRQEPGKVVYWVLPGPRELSEIVFGTPADPRFTCNEKLGRVNKPPIEDLLEKLPFLVCVPTEQRQTNDAGTAYTVLETPTLFSDRAQPLPLKKGSNGWFEATFIDRVEHDQSGPPGKTPDEAELVAEFSDPQGNRYRVELDHVVQPPFPGYETDGGVMIDGFHHGITGTGSPLMPKLYTRAALWGVAHVSINGEKLDGFRVVHLMTTEIVRDRDYELALDEEMPLEPEERHIRGQEHHTHLVVLPIEPPPPTFNPEVTAFGLPNGKTQPFIHLMFEQDEIVEWSL